MYRVVLNKKHNNMRTEEIELNIEFLDGIESTEEFIDVISANVTKYVDKRDNIISISIYDRNNKGLITCFDTQAYHNFLMYTKSIDANNVGMVTIRATTMN